MGSDIVCLFCFPAAISPRQLLVTTENFYLLAPVGQVLEGFLSIVTKTCQDEPFRLRCFDDLPEGWTAEVDSLKRIVEDFYREVYDASPVFYEQGRGGGLRSSFREERYSYHPHLCALPGPLKIHGALAERFASHACAGFPHIRSVTGPVPYIYVQTPQDPAVPGPVVYTDPGGTDGVESFRLKKALVECNGISAGWDWRNDPGEKELELLVEKFDHWYTARFRHF